ncbi:hypothetical protein [Erwinia typographi]|nr:hypothetical protein [Erwinia typographi]
MNKPIQIVRLYNGDAFIGLDVAVDGATIGSVLSAKMVCIPDDCPRLVVEFALGINGEDELGQGFKVDLADERLKKVSQSSARANL